MKICISGYGSSGKTTLGHELAMHLHIKHVNESYKSTVSNDVELIAKMRKLIKSNDKAFAKKFDNKIASMAKGDCVLTNWLSPWLIPDATVRVWINASLQTRAKRRSKLNKLPYAKELALLRQYDRLTHDHFKQVYGIDINDHSVFDMELNSEKLSIKEMVALISGLAKAREKR